MRARVGGGRGDGEVAGPGAGRIEGPLPLVGERLGALEVIFWRRLTSQTLMENALY